MSDFATRFTQMVKARAERNYSAEKQNKLHAESQLSVVTDTFENVQRLFNH